VTERSDDLTVVGVAVAAGCRGEEGKGVKADGRSARFYLEEIEKELEKGISMCRRVRRKPSHPRTRMSKKGRSSSGGGTPSEKRGKKRRIESQEKQRVENLLRPRKKIT